MVCKSGFCCGQTCARKWRDERGGDFCGDSIAELPIWRTGSGQIPSARCIARPPGATDQTQPEMAPARSATTAVLLAGLTAHASKLAYNTQHLKGFYTERICGTVFTDRCYEASSRIVCGEVTPYRGWGGC